MLRRFFSRWVLPTLVLVCLPVLAIAQPVADALVTPEPPVTPVAGIMALVLGVLGLVGTAVARFSETPATLPWYLRVARVVDMLQVVDSTRRLDDPPPQ